LSSHIQHFSSLHHTLTLTLTHLQRAIEAQGETTTSFPAVAFRDSGLWLMDEGASALLQGQGYRRM
jgi:hypothetical protein